MKPKYAVNCFCLSQFKLFHLFIFIFKECDNLPHSLIIHYCSKVWDLRVPSVLPERPLASALPERPLASALPERPLASVLPERPPSFLTSRAPPIVRASRASPSVRVSRAPPRVCISRAPPDVCASRAPPDLCPHVLCLPSSCAHIWSFLFPVHY